MRLTSAHVPKGARGVNDVIRAIYKSGFVQAADGERHRPSVSIPLDTGSILYELVRATRPNNTLEVGLAYGLSALFIAQALRDNGHGHHVAVDPHQATEFRSLGLLNLERAGLRDLVDWREATSDVELPSLWQAGERFEFAFIDGCHDLDVALSDFRCIDKMLLVGGHVVFDDIWLPAIRKVVSLALSDRPYELIRANAAVPPAWWKKLARLAHTLFRDPLGPEWRLKLQTSNVAVLRKLPTSVASSLLSDGLRSCAVQSRASLGKRASASLRRK